MKLGNFTGITGIPNQDIAMWETMGRIVDRSKDRLGASDLAIVEFRRMMVAAARTFAAGGPAIGTVEPRIPHAKLEILRRRRRKATNWRSLGAAEEERAAAQTTAAE